MKNNTVETRAQDRKKWELHEILLGLVALVLLIILIAYLGFSLTHPSSGKPLSPEAIANDIRPFGTVNIAPGSHAPMPATALSGASSTPTPSNPLPSNAASPSGAAKSAGPDSGKTAAHTVVSSSERTEGKKVFNETCIACHGSGVLGAPKAFSATEWAPHLAKGKAVLLEHAMNGYKAMPPHGGNPSLTQAQLSAAIDYMSTPK